eukprot:TRINITY_DN141_c0_g1::TRINITY_DN141_c0_g1_i1::g.14380::m.14380 TRINITY_DN141_c0_g1::TRINITY_DN141_c0_g1_i1::g.14380  ORF type:complete len:387 (+),score=98.96,sp/O96622/ARPC1_DICDI/42.32/2e-101,WD40/PF00400.27/3.6e+02,WD40/PF00400.27/1.8e-07,WD40/PF00400.27/0.98,WD40/PF00400.27/7.5e-07,WD40/PF00400.27/0.032,WD40/PF00400.27/2.1e+03,WD40/PF00400.27/0.25,Rax2/PF12768.2/66,Rax2/PF12768.2/0.0073,Rax2/PF12768.2/1.2e+03,Rax2/PF12768.2/3.7e+03,eIF2A/PF08662.6/3.3e+02,eIF2A/PF08662.6/0.02,eIF2A/PF08662.6/
MSVQDLADCITCHAWNKDRSLVAICPNTADVLIYSADTWELKYTLKEHTQVVTGIDWALETNRLVTCSQDRNAFVWSFDGSDWKPTLVILRLNRACTSVKWSPKEDKFAVGSGAKCVSVCYFEKDNDWWVSKLIKKHKSTVLAIAWHPDNVLLATGSSDFKCRIFSGFIKGVDKKGQHSQTFGEALPGAGSKEDLLAEFECRGWVHSVAFSPSGQSLAFAGHDSSLTFVTLPATNGEKPQVQLAKNNDLGYRVVTFISDDKLVAAGYDCNPALYRLVGKEWVNKGKIDEGKKKEEKAGGAFGAARSMFANQARLGQATSSSSSEQNTLHQNAISSLCVMGKDKFSSSGMDGKVVIWDLASIESQLAHLKI